MSLVVNGKEYGFAVTVDAFLAMGDLKIDKSRNLWSDRQTIDMALIMNKAHEDRACLQDPDHVPDYLTRELIGIMTVDEFRLLSSEVMAVYLRDMHISVPTQKKTAAESL